MIHKIIVKYKHQMQNVVHSVVFKINNQVINQKLINSHLNLLMKLIYSELRTVNRVISKLKVIRKINNKFKLIKTTMNLNNLTNL